MDQPTATIIAAVLALVGVLAGVGASARRSRRERQEAKATTFDAERGAAYKALWSQVEGIAVAMRTEALRGEALRLRLREINAELMKGGLHVDPADRKLVEEYVNAVVIFHAAVDESADGETKRKVAETGLIPQEVLARVQSIHNSKQRADSLRERLVNRFREVLKT